MFVWIICVECGARVNEGFATVGAFRRVPDAFPYEKLKTPTLVCQTGKGLYVADARIFARLDKVPFDTKVIDLSSGVVIKRLERVF